MNIIVTALLAIVTALFNGPVVAAGSLPACVTEDQSSPCFWDATQHGNGTGQSFIVNDDGSVTYVQTV